jgi:hypothetical protein
MAASDHLAVQNFFKALTLSSIQKAFQKPLIKSMFVRTHWWFRSFSRRDHVLSAGSEEILHFLYCCAQITHHSVSRAHYALQYSRQAALCLSEAVNA